MSKIGFSTGAVYSWDDSINRQIGILKKLGCNAIEISYGMVSSLDEELNMESIKYLKSLDYVSIHAPFFDNERNDLYYTNSKLIRKLLTQLSRVYKSINAKSIVFHPNLIKDYSIFDKLTLNICLENMPRERNISIEQLSVLMHKQPKFNLVLDTAHAMSWKKSTLLQLVTLFKDRIQYVHLSDRRYSIRNKRLRDHQQLLSCSDLSKFDSLKKLNCPMIVEVSIKDKKADFQNLKNEYSLVKDFFKE
jgi:endonuclease IV